MLPRPRIKNKRDVLPVMHIICEGEKTEPIYISNYIKLKYPNYSSKRISFHKTAKNTPVQLVEEAENIINGTDFANGDEVWVAYDREAVSKYSDSLHYQAMSKANALTINVAISNVCFEVWLLLHLVKGCGAFSSYTDLKKRSEFTAKLKTIGIKNYDKACAKSLQKIMPNVDKAKERAIALNQATLVAANPRKTQPYHLNPYTDIYKLLNTIDSFLE